MRKRKTITKRVVVKKTRPIKKLLTWKKENTYKKAVPNKPGLYRFYDKDGKQLYVGHARKLRHRVQSYMQKDDYKEHPTKRTLRPRIAKYSYRLMPLKKARELERKTKKKNRYNVW